MKHSMILGAVLLVATPAHAWVKVTNLSGVPQSITYSGAGTDTVYVIAPNATQYITGSNGFLALNDPATIAKAKAAKPGPLGEVLGDVVAANRTSRIPAKNDSQFVIWPDGRLMIQRHKSTGGTSW